MRKVFLFFMLGVSLIMPKIEYKNYDNIRDSFEDSNGIEITIDGDSNLFCKGTSEYNNILHEFKKMLVNSYEVPSLGVSIDELTVKEKQKGVWVEFIFDRINYSNDMPFNSLLVVVNEGYYGFNVIRKYEEKYDGRGYYINLVGNNMNTLYEYLKNKY